MKKPKGIKEIEKAVEETMAIFSCIKRESLNENGAIIYANANDGTSFDWGANGRLCEFFVYHGEALDYMGYIKLCVLKNNTMEICVYPCGERLPTYKAKRECGFSAEHLKNVMLREADGKDKYDEKLSEIFED